MRKFNNHLNYIPSDSLKSICDQEILEQNKFQKILCTDFESHQDRYYQDLELFLNSYVDAKEIDFVNQEIKICRGIISQSDQEDYHETWKISMKKYLSFLEDKVLRLMGESDGVHIPHTELNNQEVVFLYLWKYKNGLMYFKNESHLASFLECHCVYKNGNKVNSVRSIISRIKSCDIDMNYMIERIKSDSKNFNFINW